MGALGYALAQANRQKPNANLTSGERFERGHPNLATV